MLAHHGIAGCFHIIRGSAADETAAAASAATGGKAGIIAAALDATSRAARRPDAVMVGDRAQDVAGRRANGLDCIGVGWGFAPDGELEAARRCRTVVHDTAACDATIEDARRPSGDRSPERGAHRWQMFDGDPLDDPRA